jgi:dolichol-phosphate mannosyltransferase
MGVLRQDPEPDARRGDRGPVRVMSVVIPARNEEGCIAATVQRLHDVLAARGVESEIVVVDDGSTDRTWAILEELKSRIPGLVVLENTPPHGFGRAVTRGLDVYSGDAVAIMMADQSDDPADVVRYWEELNAGWECVFGSRFVRGGGVVDYPWLKLVLNRLANWLIAQLFRIHLNDTTNAFKAYRRNVIDGCRPLLSPHFNLTIEIPLKSIIRGYEWTVVPITWRNRKTGESKLKIKEMGSRYFFIMMYCWLEKWFSRGDYHRDPDESVPSIVGAGRSDERA